MHQEIEIEFKNLLIKEEFDRLCSAFTIHPEDFKKQVNYYFETPEFDLKKAGAALRIRFKKEKIMLTLKQPHPEGLLETHQPITHAEAEALINHTTSIPEGNVKTQLNLLKILPGQLKCLGSLTTYRAECSYLDGDIMLDHSVYFDTEDFECEYEARNRVIGEKAFAELLQHHKIARRPTPNKIQRFYNQKIMEESSGE